MILEFHDSEVGNSLAARHNFIDYDYQAEMVVQEHFRDDYKIPLSHFILKDDLGERAKWTVKDGGIALTWKSDRFQGEWVLESVFK